MPPSSKAKEVENGGVGWKRYFLMGPTRTQMQQHFVVVVAVVVVVVLPWLVVLLDYNQEVIGDHKRICKHI